MASKTSKGNRLAQKELILSLLITLGMYYLFYFVVRWNIPCDDEATVKLVYALKWMIYPVTCLWLGILFVFIKRLARGEINPLDRKEDSALKVHSHYIESTMKSLLLLFLTVVLLALYMPAKNLAIVPAVCIIYSAGRLCSWYGHCHRTVHCYFGKLMTLLSTVAPLMYLTVRILICNFM